MLSEVVVFYFYISLCLSLSLSPPLKMASPVKMLRAGRLVTPQLYRPRAVAARPVAAVALPDARPSCPLLSRQRRSMGVGVREVKTKKKKTTSVQAGPSAATVRAASRVPVWLIPDVSQLDATAAESAWALAQEIPFSGLVTRAVAEIGIAFLLAGLGVKLLGKLAVESMKVLLLTLEGGKGGLISAEEREGKGKRVGIRMLFFFLSNESSH